MKMDLISSSYDQDSDEKQYVNTQLETNQAIDEEPFYLLKDTPAEDQLNGSTNLILYNQLQHAFNKYCCKKVKEHLGSFLSHFPSNIDTLPNDEIREQSTLGSLFNKPIVYKEIHPLSALQLSKFKLHPGPLPEKYILMVQGDPNLAKSDSKDNGEKKAKKAKRSDDDEGHEKKKKKKEKKKKKKSSTND